MGFPFYFKCCWFLTTLWWAFSQCHEKKMSQSDFLVNIFVIFVLYEFNRHSGGSPQRCFWRDVGLRGFLPAILISKIDPVVVEGLRSRRSNDESSPRIGTRCFHSDEQTWMFTVLQSQRFGMVRKIQNCVPHDLSEMMTNNPTAASSVLIYLFA